jgi:hypothetical protein
VFLIATYESNGRVPMVGVCLVHRTYPIAESSVCVSLAIRLTPTGPTTPGGEAPNPPGKRHAVPDTNLDLDLYKGIDFVELTVRMLSSGRVRSEAKMTESASGPHTREGLASRLRL